MATYKIGVFAGHDDDTWETTGGKGINSPIAENGIYEEYDSNIVIAKELSDRLKKYDEFEVFFPQHDGLDMGLRDRVNFCNSNNVDLAIFIHSNAGGKSATGACAFHYPKSKGEEWAKHYADEFREGNYPLWQNGTFECNPNDGWSWFYVIASTTMPAILTENFFFTNREELKKYLLNPDELSNIAGIHERATLKYFGVEEKLESEVKEGVVEPVTEPVPEPVAEQVSKPVASPIVKPKPKKEVSGKIATIQRTLNSRYDFNIAVDNEFGNQTQGALVKALQIELNKQANANLSIDGKFGPITRKSIISIKEKAQGNITWILQAILDCQGFNLGAIDGIFGIKTRSAVKAFQGKNNLAVDGIAGPQTFQMLFK